MAKSAFTGMIKIGRKKIISLSAVFALLLVVATPLILPRAAAADPSPVRYVASTGSDTSDCLTQASPCQTINYAIGQASPGDTITLSSDMTVSSAVVIDRSLTIDGGGFTLYSPFAKTSNDNNAAIKIGSSDVTVNDLTINGTGGTKLHGINIYKSANVNLNNVTVTNNGHAAIVVNGSTVTATNLNTSNNSWGAVNVDPGSGVTTPSAFTLNSGTLAESTQIWSDGSNVSGTATVTVNATGYSEYKVGGTTAGYFWTNQPLTNAATITSGSVTTYYSTIQAAINAATSGDTINVAPGTYTENITITKPLTVDGAGQASTTIVPASSDPTCGGTGGGTSLCTGASSVILVQANDVTIHDLTVDGNNPDISSGVTAGGSDIDARNGIITDYNTGAFNNLNVHDTTVQNIYLRGIQDVDPTLVSGDSFSFDNNTVSNVQGSSDYSVAMFAKGLTGDFTGNTVSDTPDALNSNWSHGVSFIGNTVTNSASGIHTDNADSFGGSTADVIQNNTISNGSGDALGDGTGSYGIWALAPYLSLNITGNTITNVQNGIAIFGQSANVTDTITSNTIDGNSVSGSRGILVTTDLLGYGTSDVAAQITSNNVQNNSTGISVASQNGHSATVSDLHLNQLTGNSVGIDNATSTTLDATKNWWGSADDPSALVSGDVTYSPWCAQAACSSYTSDVTVALPASSNQATTSGDVTLSSSTVTAVIPDGTTVTATGGGTWDGTIMPPTTTSVSVPGASGFDTTVGLGIKVGSDDFSLTFDKGVRLFFPGQAGKQVGFIAPGGTFTEITDVCSDDTQAVGDALPAGGACKIDVGGNLIVWTKHFTTYATFTRTAIPVSSSSSSSTTTSSTTSKPTYVTYASYYGSANGEQTAASTSTSEVAGAATTVSNVSQNGSTSSKQSKNSRFLVLGWYWLIPIAILVLGAAYWTLRRRAVSTDK